MVKVVPRVLILTVNGCTLWRLRYKEVDGWNPRGSDFSEVRSRKNGSTPTAVFKPCWPWVETCILTGQRCGLTWIHPILNRKKHDFECLSAISVFVLYLSKCGKSSMFGIVSLDLADLRNKRQRGCLVLTFVRFFF